MTDINDYKNFYESLGKVLPCKYCKESFPIFMNELPIEEYGKSQRDMAYWAYLMHNKVNNKLRKQGFLKTPDPPFEEVYNKYQGWKAGCSSGVVGPTGSGTAPARCGTPHPEEESNKKESMDGGGRKKTAFPGTKCHAQTKGGKRCKRIATHDNLCTIHDKSSNKLGGGTNVKSTTPNNSDYILSPRQIDKDAEYYFLKK
jgi:hypothetical protein